MFLRLEIQTLQMHDQLTVISSDKKRETMTSHALNLTILLIASCLLVVGPSLRAQSYESTVETKFYKPGNNARAVFASGLSSAISTNNHLMVVFGADWCPDCRKLYENLASEEVASYMDDHMNFVTIDVGRKDLNIDLAAELGVTVSNGIPVAVFFSPDGDLIGTTNQGELEPSRYFSSSQILRFVRKVVEYQEVTKPFVDSTKPDEIISVEPKFK